MNPPEGSGFENSYLEFPVDFEICHQDLSSNFALKLHALLCRPYLKGRDWYDFSWYVKESVVPNMPLLENALLQSGSWSTQQELKIDGRWLAQALEDKVDTVDWEQAKDDVRPFLSVLEVSSLELWGAKFFKNKVGKIEERCL